jgi:hypothetical protein
MIYGILNMINGQSIYLMEVVAILSEIFISCTSLIEHILILNARKEVLKKSNEGHRYNICNLNLHVTKL